MIGVLGASGFIGGHLKRILEEQNDVLGVSLRDTNWTKQMSICDSWINLIGKAHDHKKQATEKDFYHANFALLKEVYGEFLKSSGKLFIHISSLAALEETASSKPLTENDSCNPTSWYGKSKHAAEMWLLEQDIPSGKTVVILRPPMVHGAGDKGNLGLLYKLISKGVPYPLSKFNNLRSFISIDNFCFFIQRIIENRDRISSGLYHIADNEAVSTKEIIEIIQKVLDKNVVDIGIPRSFVKAIAKVGDYIPIPLNTLRLKKMTSDLVVSNTKIKNALKISELPLTAQEGLKQTIQSFR